MTRSRYFKRLQLAVAILVVSVVTVFVANGLLSGRATPEFGRINAVAPIDDSDRCSVLALNLAKAGFHQGGLSFSSTADVRMRLDDVAEALRSSGADLVVLSEVVFEAGPCPVNQVQYLAEVGGFSSWAFGENYSFGIPWFRIRSGNAVLSKLPLRTVALCQLPGGASFLDPTNHRRVLWVEVQLRQRWVLIGAVRNDSVDLANNARQVAAILEYSANRETLLAGDFNASPDATPVQLIRSSGRFSDVLDSTPTFPSSAPERRIDYIFAPRSWTRTAEAVLRRVPSDHLPVHAVFTVPAR